MKNGRILRTRAPLRHRSQERGESRDHRDRRALPRGRIGAPTTRFAHHELPDDHDFVPAAPARVRRGDRLQRRGCGLRRWRRQLGRLGRDAGAGGRRPRVVGLRARRAAQRRRRDRNAGPRSHRLDDAGRPRAAPTGEWRAPHPLRLAGRDVAQHDRRSGEDHRRGRLSRRGAVGGQRRPDLVGALRLRAAAAQLGAELRPGAHVDEPVVLPGVGRPALGQRQCRRRHRNAVPGRVLRRGRVPGVVGRVRRERLRQHADHRRFAGQRLLRLRRHRSESCRARQRHRARRRERGRHVGLGELHRRRCRDREGRDEQRAGAFDRRHDGLRRGQHRGGGRKRAGRLPRRTRQRDVRGEGADCAQRPLDRSAPRSSATTPAPRRPSAPTATSTTASSSATSARTTHAAGCSTSTPRSPLPARRAASAGIRRLRSCRRRWSLRTSAARRTC